MITIAGFIVAAVLALAAGAARMLEVDSQLDIAAAKAVADDELVQWASQRHRIARRARLLTGYSAVIVFIVSVAVFL